MTARTHETSGHAQAPVGRLPQPLRRCAWWVKQRLGHGLRCWIGIPWAYEFYYRRFTDVQQGSWGHGYHRPTTIGDAPHLLIFTMRSWLIHLALDAAFAKERQRQGWRATAVGCDRGITTCDNMYYGEYESPLNWRCNHCARLVKRHCEGLGVDFVSIRRYMHQHGLLGDELPDTRDYEALVHVSWIRLLRSVHPSEPGELALRDALVGSCRTLDRFFSHYLATNRVDEAIMTNGKFFAEQLLRRHCDERNIPYICYEQGILKETAVFARGGHVVPLDTKASWETRRDTALTGKEEAQLTRLDDFTMNYDSGGIPFYSHMIEDRARICDEFRINPQKDVAVLFTNTIWDSAAVDVDTIFESMFDWITCCIEQFSADPEMQLVIRVHPVEVKMPPCQQTRDRVDDFVARHFPDVSNNIIVVPPESEASPYVLMDMASLGLVYTSSTGFEMAARGKPVIVAGLAHYAGTEFVYTPETRDAFLSMLDRRPEPRPDQVELARRYIYMFYFERMVPYGDLISKEGGYRILRDLRTSSILERAGL